jgi:hypothetical protein
MSGTVRFTICCNANGPSSTVWLPRCYIKRPSARKRWPRSSGRDWTKHRSRSHQLCERISATQSPSLGLNLFLRDGNFLLKKPFSSLASFDIAAPNFPRARDLPIALNRQTRATLENCRPNSPFAHTGQPFGHNDITAVGRKFMNLARWAGALCNRAREVAQAPSWPKLCFTMKCPVRRCRGTSDH